MSSAAVFSVERVHGLHTSYGDSVRLTFRAVRGYDHVTVHTADEESRLVGTVRPIDSERPAVHLAPDFRLKFGRRRGAFRRCALALHHLAADPEALSCLPRLPGPDSEWLPVDGTDVAFTANSAARWVSLYAIEDGEPVFVGQVARIGQRGQTLWLAEAWEEWVTTRTAELVIAAAVQVWRKAWAVRGLEARR